MQFTFRKFEKLTHKNIIDKLFKEGKSISVYPLRLVYLPYEFEDKVPGQVMIAVSKRKFKLAVSRNRNKRILREAYRMQKHKIYALSNQTFAMVLAHNGRENLSLKTANSALQEIIEKWEQREEKKAQNQQNK